MRWAGAARALITYHQLVTVIEAVMDVIDAQAPGKGSRHHRVPAQGRDEGLGPNGGQDGDGRRHLLRQQTVPPQHPDPRVDKEAHGGAESARRAVRTQPDRDQTALHLRVEPVCSEMSSVA